MRAIASLAIGIGASLIVAQPAAAVDFTFATISGDTLTPAQAAAFTTAAHAWSGRLSDPITVNLLIGFRSLGGNTLGGATPMEGTVDAGLVKMALRADMTSADDMAAVASLPTYGMADNLTLTTAQARAIGIPATGFANDGMIEFSSDYSYSTSRDANGAIAADTFDLIGIAEHEIEHILGFDSSLDTGGAATVLDQFRFAAPGVRSLTAGESAYFSLDGGTTRIADFSVGGANTYQASHWLSGTTSAGAVALMNPAIAPGQVVNITPLDLRAADVVGYNVTAVPEPATWSMMIAGFGAIGFVQRRRRIRTRVSYAVG